MNNKGTQALLKSDISAIKSILKGNVNFSVSTTDIEGVKRLDLSLNAVLPPIIDIPYEKADSSARRFGYFRGSFKHKIFALAHLVCMLIQLVLSIVSVISVRVGLRAFYRPEVVKRIRDCNLVVSCSDENFKEGTSQLPLNIYWIVTWWSMLIARTWEISTAKFFRKPIVMFPNSVGPFRTWLGRFLLRVSLNSCNCILIRDLISDEIVNSLGIRSNRILTSDTALLFKTAREMTLDDFSHPVVGVSPGIYSHSLSRKEVENYILAHAKALDMAIENYGLNVVFLPHYVTGFQDDDLKVCELVLHEMKNKDRAKIVNTQGVAEFKSLLDQMDMIISSKMHPAVLGVSGYVPTLCIAYDHKQIGFFKNLGMADCTVPLREFSCEKLLAKIDFIWNDKEKIRASLTRRIPALQENIKSALRQAIAPFVEI